MSRNHDCKGLWACNTHPTPYVVKDRRYRHTWWVMPPGESLDRRKRYTLAEAMNTARGWQE